MFFVLLKKIFSVLLEEKSGRWSTTLGLEAYLGSSTGKTSNPEKIEKLSINFLIIVSMIKIRVAIKLKFQRDMTS